MIKKIKENEKLKGYCEKASSHANCVKKYIKENYKSKKFITIAISAIITLLLLCALICKEDNKVKYHYVGNGYVKEVIKDDQIINRFWCNVSQSESSKTTDKVIYYCERQLVEFTR